MKETNLLSLVSASKGLNKVIYERYFDLYASVPKPNEVLDLQAFVDNFLSFENYLQLLNGYFFGYTIPQISKEFDLLRFGQNSVINIELKSINTGDKIHKQLIRNQYYLSFLNKEVYTFTYISEVNLIYSLDSERNLIEVQFNRLIEILSEQKTIKLPDVNLLFNPSNYLVSPFNSTEEFIQGRYFLTAHQEEIKKTAIQNIKRVSNTFLSIIGKAGTGKTLLTFDIAKDLINEGEKVLIIHCGILNDGHKKLRDKYGWEVIPVKDWFSIKKEGFKLVILDETQRIYPTQLETIIEAVKLGNGNCIFSYDKQQCLRKWEESNNISQLIADKTSSIVFQLTEKIRTNKEIASFITALFDKSLSFENINRDNISLSYFEKSKDVKNYLEFLRSNDWKIINFTPSKHDVHPYDEYTIFTEDSTHEVIGQEFDKVIAVIDSHFCYKNNELAIDGYKLSPYYHPAKMLFQIMTRTRKKLSIVILNNPIVMSRCLEILKT